MSVGRFLRALVCTFLWFSSCNGTVLPHIYHRDLESASRGAKLPKCSPAPYAKKKIAMFRNSVTTFVESNKGKDVDLIRDKIASKPIAMWVGDWSGDVKQKGTEIREGAQRQSAMYTIVINNIPHRDCNQYSGGNEDLSKNAYLIWIQNLADGLTGGDGIVVLEPDALALIDCLSEEMKNERFEMMAAAVKKLKSAGAKVYIDAGHANWEHPDEMAPRLRKAGITDADGFALNTANGVSTARSMKYGNYISRRLDGKGYVIDVSRNGGTVEGQGEAAWCNSPTFRLGVDPTFDTEKYGCFVHALLWIKVPGESDGVCNGATAPAGSFSVDLAKMLIS